MIDIKFLCEVALQAGKAILEIYQAEQASVTHKEDQSPLTQADLASNKIICQRLNEKYPQIPLISEENKSVDFIERKKWDECFIIDPLDGTKEFIKKNGEFTVNIAWIKKGSPLAGVVYAPVLDEMYYADENGAFVRDKKGISKLPLKECHEMIIVGSRSHPSAEFSSYIDEIKKENPELQIKSIGSSLKFCLIAKGEASLYPRLGPTMEWDTAAAQVVLEKAGGQVLDFESKTPLKYNKENLLNNYFIAKI